MRKKINKKYSFDDETPFYIKKDYGMEDEVG